MQHKKVMDGLVERYLYDMWITLHPVAPLRKRLKTHGFITAHELKALKDGARVRVAGLLVMIHTPPTRSGKRVMFITIEDETGLMDLVAFENVQKRWAKAFLLSEILMVEGILKKEGKGQGARSIVIKRVIKNKIG